MPAGSPPRLSLDGHCRGKVSPSQATLGLGRIKRPTPHPRHAQRDPDSRDSSPSQVCGKSGLFRLASSPLPVSGLRQGLRLGLVMPAILAKPGDMDHGTGVGAHPPTLPGIGIGNGNDAFLVNGILLGDLPLSGTMVHGAGIAGAGSWELSRNPDIYIERASRSTFHLFAVYSLVHLIVVYQISSVVSKLQTLFLSIVSTSHISSTQ